MLAAGGGEARDIFADRPGKQGRVLRQIADMRGEPFAVPVAVLGIVDPDFAGVGRDRARRDARGSRLAGPRRADPTRPDGRSVGKEWVSTGSIRWSTINY